MSQGGSVRTGGIGVPALCSLCRETGEIMSGLIKFLFPGHVRCRMWGCSAAGRAQRVCPAAVHSTLPVGPAPQVPDGGAPVVDWLWDSPKISQQELAVHLAYCPTSSLPVCKTSNAKVAGFWGISFPLWGWIRALCLVTDLWKFLLMIFSCPVTSD